MFNQSTYRDFSIFTERCTAWKVSRYGVLSVHIFLYSDSIRRFTSNLRIQSEYSKIQTRKNSVFGHFSRSVCVCVEGRGGELKILFEGG